MGCDSPMVNLLSCPAGCNQSARVIYLCFLSLFLSSRTLFSPTKPCLLCENNKMSSTCGLWGLSVIDGLVEDEKRRELQKQQELEKEKANKPPKPPGDASKGAGLFKVSNNYSIT